MKEIGVIILISSMLAVSPCWADRATYFDLFAFGGAGQGLNHRVNMSTYGLGIFAGIQKSWFLIGLANDYQSYAQTSKYDASEGNQSGSRFNWLAPMIGVQSSKIIYRVDYQWLGDYDLLLQTANHQTLKYLTPRGFRFGAYYRFTAKLSSGLYFQTLTYKFDEEGSTGRVGRTPGILFQTFGAGVNYSI